MSLRLLLLALVPPAAVAGANWYAMTLLLGGRSPDCLPCAGWLVAGPFVVASLVVATLHLGTSTPRPVAAPPPPPAPSLEEGALRLLGLLQEEGRLVDFLEEDIGAYDDAQIGAAARGIHEACRKALRERMTLEPVVARAEGETLEVEAGFDPAAIRLVGNISGTAPVRGVVRHAGWRVKAVTMPARQGQNTRVIAPAEVEVD